MKVIDLGDRVIFIDTIEGIYKNDFAGVYYVETTRGDYKISKNKYYEIKDMLLSLNEEKEDTPNKIEQIGKNYNIISYSLEDNKNTYDIEELIDMVQDIYDKQSEIIDRLNGE